MAELPRQSSKPRNVAAKADELIETLKRAEKLSGAAALFGGETEQEWLEVLRAVGVLSMALENYDGRVRAWL